MSSVQMEALDFKYVLLEYYKKLRISENELALILMIDHLLEQKNSFVTPDLLSMKMSLSTKEIDKTFASLIERGFISLDTGKKMKISLKPLKKKLYKEFQLTLAKEADEAMSEEKTTKLQNIYQVFEKELNSNLSPLEISLIGDWIEQGYSDELIINALKESLSKGKKSLKNVDKILLQWSARDDIEKVGTTSISKDWDKDLAKTMEIAKAKWIDD